MKKLRDFRKPERDRALSFWGPAGIAVGIILILNNVQINGECISFELKAGIEMFNLVAGIVLIVLGLLALLLIAQEKKVALANVGLMTGVSFFFWGYSCLQYVEHANGVWCWMGRDNSRNCVNSKGLYLGTKMIYYRKRSLRSETIRKKYGWAG